jgi:hypothetical protein
MLKARGLVLIGVLISLDREEGHGLLCDGSLQGWAASATRAEAAELDATISIPAACIYVVLTVFFKFTGEGKCKRVFEFLLFTPDPKIKVHLNSTYQC